MSKNQLTMSGQEQSSNNQDYETKNPLTITYYGEISTKNCLFLTESLSKLDHQSKMHQLEYLQLK